MQVTLKDIAEKAGFSVTTVSRALGGYDDVNEGTREHILRIARDMGYQPNLIARQLRSQQTQTIGMIIPASVGGMEDDFFSLLLKGVTHAATRHHYDVLVSAQFSEAEEMAAYQRIVGGRRVDGVVLARTHRGDPRIDYLRQMRHPFVVSGRLADDERSDFPYIDADSRTGLRAMVEHMVAQGHRNIGLILPPPDLAFTSHRRQGYRDGLIRAGLDYREAYITHGDLTRASGVAATTALLDAQPALTAIIACNDMMAIGAMTAIQERGLTVGDDIAVGGFDDIPLAAHTQPPLTTVRQPIYEIGVGLAEMLIHMIADDPPETPESRLLQPTLIIRDSSGSPRS
jgi:DNA-binding LacI/PurR family transcriptional regulator